MKKEENLNMEFSDAVSHLHHRMASLTHKLQEPNLI